MMFSTGDLVKLNRPFSLLNGEIGEIVNIVIDYTDSGYPVTEYRVRLANNKIIYTSVCDLELVFSN